MGGDLRHRVRPQLAFPFAAVPAQLGQHVRPLGRFQRHAVGAADFEVKDTNGLCGCHGRDTLPLFRSAGRPQAMRTNDEPLDGAYPHQYQDGKENGLVYQVDDERVSPQKGQTPYRRSV